MALTWQERRMRRAQICNEEAHVLVVESKALLAAAVEKMNLADDYIRRSNAILDAPPPRTPGAMAPVTRIREAA